MAGYWTIDNRVEALRDAWERGGIQEARPLFPDQTDEQIRSAAQRYKILRHLHRSHQPQELTPFIEAALRCEYRDGRPDLKVLSARLNVRRGWLKCQAQRLGLTRPARGRRWVAAEDAILEAGIEAGVSPQTIARKLQKAGFNRGTASVIHRKETLCWRLSRNTLTVRDVAKLFGADHKSVLRWINKGWLSAKRGVAFYAADPRESADPERQHWAISYGQLRNFMLRHFAEWDHRRMRKEILLDILIGPHWANANEREVGNG